MLLLGSAKLTSPHSSSNERHIKNLASASVLDSEHHDIEIKTKAVQQNGAAAGSLEKRAQGTRTVNMKLNYYATLRRARMLVAGLAIGVVSM